MPDQVSTSNLGKGWSKGKAFVPRRICATCKKDFYAPPVLIRRGGGKYCSVKCHGVAQSAKAAAEREQLPIVPCVVCGVPINRLPSHMYRSTAPTCSRQCATSQKRIQRPERTCPVCGQIVLSAKRKYCSPTCRSVATSGAASVHAKPQVERVCQTCGKTFSVKPAIAERGFGLFCGRPCFAAWKGSQAENTHTWGNGGKRADLGGLYVRSSWEANYARYLNWLVAQRQIASWEYEVDTFEFQKIKRGTRFYTPDFKIHNPDGSIEYHEIKGYMDKRSATKLRRMAKYYPAVKVVLIDGPVYKAIAKTACRLVDNWESKKGSAYL